MKQHIITILFIFLTFQLYAQFESKDLNEAQINFLIDEIEQISEDDQRYRVAISLGTLNDSILQIDKKMRETATLEEYMAFRKTIDFKLEKHQQDSLWQLQHHLDFENYNRIRAIVDEYGYPSSERLGIKEDKIFSILLHPPIEIEPLAYLDDMSPILKDEVKEGRMDAQQYASFYDNIKVKILKEPQVYGTSKIFDPATMSLGLPIIDNITFTNSERIKIGLPELKPGEYQLTGKKAND